MTLRKFPAEWVERTRRRPERRGRQGPNVAEARRAGGYGRHELTVLEAGPPRSYRSIPAEEPGLRRAATRDLPEGRCTLRDRWRHRPPTWWRAETGGGGRAANAKWESGATALVFRKLGE